jgi:hypothetical protein
VCICIHIYIHIYIFVYIYTGAKKESSRLRGTSPSTIGAKKDLNSKGKGEEKSNEFSNFEKNRMMFESKPQHKPLTPPFLSGMITCVFIYKYIND